MWKTEVLWKILDYFVFEMFPMIWHQFVGENKPCDDMAEEKLWSSFRGFFICGHDFCPFGQLINDHHYVIIVVQWCGVAYHEFYAPFSNGACYDYYVQGSYKGSCLVSIALASLTYFDCLDVVMENGGLEVTHM